LAVAGIIVSENERAAIQSWPTAYLLLSVTLLRSPGSIFHRSERTAFRLNTTASASTSTFRATEKLCHSTVPPVAS
jgi:hypothetical protein